ncbi:MAG: glycolate oxidase subunit GlcF [Burkholderiaceae bacterium]|nr:glycolate oxidase subunit GlcF [Burkholderiaceae bacterium]
MQTNIIEAYQQTMQGQQAQAILRQCVHCGFCQATCPTYQVLGDELDSPRGRIYLIKNLLEGKDITEKSRTHLDRCLSCRNCETTCPSGVQYGHLLDIGRNIIEEKINRSAFQMTVRFLLKKGLPHKLFKPLVAMGRILKPLLAGKLQKKIIPRRPVGVIPRREQTRKVFLLAGCVQPALLPSIDAATIRVLDAVGVQALIAPNSACCGALRFHLDDQPAALRDMRRNIDAWWPMVESGQVQALVMNASGCGAMVREYGYYLQHDALYADKARRISALSCDLAEYLSNFSEALAAKLKPAAPLKAVFHPPCTLQHWQQLRGVTEKLLTQCGVECLPFNETHLCCGAAGTYSLLQPAIADVLRERKLSHLTAAQPQMILSANIGCLIHLQEGTTIPVLHWIEWLDERLNPKI